MPQGYDESSSLEKMLVLRASALTASVAITKYVMVEMGPST